MKAKQQGFNLIEILVALFVIATVLGSVSTLLVSSTNNITQLERSVIANWVGLNQIELAKLSQQDEGELSGTVEMAGRLWSWEQEVRPTEQEADMLEIIVRVYEGDDYKPEQGSAAIVKGFRVLP